MQIKRREGDQDRVRLTGLRIKGGFKTAKVAAEQMHKVCSTRCSRKKKKRKRLQLFIEKWQSGLGIWYRNRMTLKVK